MHNAFQFSRTFYSPSLGFLMQMIRKMRRKTTAPQPTAIRMTRYRDRCVLGTPGATQQRCSDEQPRAQRQVHGADRVPGTTAASLAMGCAAFFLSFPVKAPRVFQRVTVNHRGPLGTAIDTICNQGLNTNFEAGGTDY